MRNLLAFSTGILVGAAIGAAATFLFTPASGEDMRNNTREQFRQLLDESAQAAAARRAELEGELAQLTNGRQPKPTNT